MLIIAQGCAWEPMAITYPSGLVIVLADQHTLDDVCSHKSDRGTHIDHAAGCYDKSEDTIYLLDSCEGAKSLPHELAHREGIADPEKAGFNW